VHVLEGRQLKIYVREFGCAEKEPFRVKVHKIAPDSGYTGEYRVLVSRAKGKRYPHFLRISEYLGGKKKSWISIDYFTP